MKKSILSLVTTVALAGIAHAGSVTFTNWGGTSTQIQANGVAIADGSGFIAVGTTALSPADLAADVAANGGVDLSTAGRAALAASFTQFGDSITFGFSGFAGYFEGLANGDGGSAALAGNPIILVAGTGTSIADSDSLLIIAGDGNFAADNPVFAAAVGTDAPGSQVVFGAAGGTNSINAALPALQMGNVADVIPEPGVSILALFSAGLLVLRRRR
jgi:hypothetical protein